MQVLARRLLHKSHLKVTGRTSWYPLTPPGVARREPRRNTGCQGNSLRRPPRSRRPFPPPHAVTRPRASPPPGALRRWLLARRLGLTILTPSAEPMAGIARGSFTRVRRCLQYRGPITVLRRRAGSPHKPITAKEAGLALLAPPPTRRGRFRGCSTWWSLGGGGRHFPRSRPEF